MFRNWQLRPWLRMRTCRPTYWGKRTAVLRQSKLCHQVVQLGFLFSQLKLQGRRGSSNVKARTMKGASGHRNSRQASPEQPPPSYEEIAGSSSQPGAAAGKPLPTDFPPSYTEQEQNVRVVYLPAPNFGPKSAKVVCSSCQVLSLVSFNYYSVSPFIWHLLSGKRDDYNLQPTKHDGLGGLLRSLLHHALALLLCPILRRQLQRCEAQLSQL